MLYLARSWGYRFGDKWARVLFYFLVNLFYFLALPSCTVLNALPAPCFYLQVSKLTFSVPLLCQQSCLAFCFVIVTKYLSLRLSKIIKICWQTCSAYFWLERFILDLCNKWKMRCCFSTFSEYHFFPKVVLRPIGNTFGSYLCISSR